MSLRRFAVVLGAALLAAGAPGVRADPLYTVDFLPTGFTADALNNSGQVVGTSGDAAAIFSGGILTSLAAIAPAAMDGRSTAREISPARWTALMAAVRSPISAAR